MGVEEEIVIMDTEKDTDADGVQVWLCLQLGKNPSTD